MRIPKTFIEKDIKAFHDINESEDIFELYSSSQILTLTFATEQILGIKRELDSILNNQQMDANIVNYQFLKNTAQCISKLATKGYLQELTSYSAQKNKTKTRKSPKETLAKTREPPNETPTKPKNCQMTLEDFLI